MKAFIVVSYASWVASDFEPFLDLSKWKIIRDYGFDLPQHLESYESVAWWMNAQHAARLQRAGVAMELTAPGPKWLPAVSEELTKRPIFAADLSEFLSLPSFYESWVKPAEAKIDGFEAGWRTVEEVAELVVEHSIPLDSFVQWTDVRLNLNHEYRFYILDGMVVTGSQYLVDGVTYYDGAEGTLLNEAMEFAKFAVEEMGNNQPAAYTLDVGKDMTKQEWLVIEGNPAWCSGIYGSDPAKVISVIEKSCYDKSDEGEFLWIPDAFLKARAERKVLLR
jgi:hypothetical protein